jgi:Predicted pPIWI-associating nuclease
MPNDAFVQSVRRRLPDNAHVQMLDDALAALAGDNRQRAQHFAVTTRELFGHVLSSRVSDDEVRRCVWYKQEQGARGPTRRQRALYLSRGGLSDDFIRETLRLDPDQFHEELKEAFDELSAKTHVRPNSAPTDPEKIEEFADLAISAFAEVFDVIDDVRNQIEQAIAPSLQDEAASTFIRETIEELDIIAGQYTTEGVLFDETRVVEIGSEFITYRVTGTVDVQLHYGGNSDPVQIDENFPFTCTITAKVSKPFNFLSDMTKMEVDTSSWHGDGQEEGEGPKDGEGGAPPSNLPH